MFYDIFKCIYKSIVLKQYLVCSARVDFASRWRNKISRFG